MPAHGAAQRELETLALLAEHLPDDCTVYHGVHWARIHQGQSFCGDIDFAVVGPSGRLLLIEQVTGVLHETADGLVKHQLHQPRLITAHLGRALESLQSRLKKISDTPYNIEPLLFCPDYQVKDPGSVGIAPERLVDAGRRQQLAAIVRNLVQAQEPPHPALPRLHRFLADELKLVPDVNALAGQAQTLYTGLSGGLAEWARKIECTPFRLRVIGTAGSGKTQLAVAVYRDAVAAGRRPLYVCFNRPLADHIDRIVPPGGVVGTFHQLSFRIYRATGHEPNFADPGVLPQLEQFFASHTPQEPWLFDDLIIDEGQDMQPAWKDQLLRLLRQPDSGRVWWLEDPMQNLYGRTPADLETWVTLRSDTNYRSPQEVLDTLNRILPQGRPIEAGSPLAGAEIGLFRYADPAEMIYETKRAITQSIAQGFKRDMIAVLSFCGRERSQLAPLDHLGDYRLKKFTGDYDLLGSPIFTAGDILLETVYRFKGQAAPCVILTEIDFAAMSELNARRLFVGATRATLKLQLVLSQQAAEVLGV